MGSEQRPHQKTQSIQRKTLGSGLLAPNVGLSKYSKKEAKKEKRLVLFRTYVGGSDGYHDTGWTFIPMPLGVLIAVAVG